MLITAVAFVIRAYNLNFNSIFIDEAAYIVIGQKILSGNFKEVIGDISWVGGFPFFYPLFAGFFFELGGIIATRMFNVVLGVASVFFIFTFTKELGLFQKKLTNETTGLIAAAFMAITAIPIEASRLAIYDGLSFTLFLLGLNIYLRAVRTKDKFFYLFTAVVFFLSFLAKYVTMFFFPFILLSAWFLTENKRKNFIKYLWIPLILLTVLYFSINAFSLREYFSGQVGDQTTTYLDVGRTFWQYTWILYALSLSGAMVLWRSKKVEVLALLFMSEVPILVHLVTLNNDSIHQHAFLSIVFILPLVGAFFAFFINKFKKIGTALTIIVIGLNLIYAMPQVEDLESFWPNSDKAASVIKEKLNSKDIVLAEGSDTIMLGIDKKIPREQIFGPFVFNYKDEEGTPAYIKAINDGYFKLVELENVYFSEEAFALINNTLPEKYVKIFDDGRIQVYQRKQ